MFDRRQFLRGARTLGIMVAAAPVMGAETLGATAMGTAPDRATEVPSSGATVDALDALEAKARQSLGPAGNCAQTSFALLAEHFDLDSEGLHLALSPFPGIGFRGETCGAVVGSMAALGLVFGSTRNDPPSRRRATYLKAQELCRRFEGRVGSTTCRGIQTASAGRWFNLLEPEEARAYAEAGGPEGCRQAVAAGVRIAAELILEGRRDP